MKTETPSVWSVVRGPWSVVKTGGRVAFLTTDNGPRTTDAPPHHGRRTAGTLRGFTLIELLLVLVILAVLAGVVVPKFIGRGEQARVTRAHTDISNIETALDGFEVDNGRYPTASEGLQALVTQPSGMTTWKTPYLKSIPKDPWGNLYIYHFPGQHNPSSYDLYSVGPDGQEGTADDITNWETGNQ